MNSLRKWFYRPKRTDTSLLAQFYYADDELSTVMLELDSFDGRKEPQRCFGLVSKLRKCQDKVLNICDNLMDEILGNERMSRDFREKFPDDIIQENLQGQLWFGAECLAAGSCIMNRELESVSIRPLAKAVTKSMDTIRVLLRKQCLQSPTEYTEHLCEMLRIFDRLFAEFEFRYVSVMIPIKSVKEHYLLQDVIVLFSETVQRALRLGLMCQEQIDMYDPALMFTIPRLAIFAGLIVYPNGPLRLDQDIMNISEMFRPFKSLLCRIRELLWILSRIELSTLEHCLCSESHTDVSTSPAASTPLETLFSQSVNTDTFVSASAIVTTQSSMTAEQTVVSQVYVAGSPGVPNVSSHSDISAHNNLSHTLDNSNASHIPSDVYPDLIDVDEYLEDFYLQHPHVPRMMSRSAIKRLTDPHALFHHVSPSTLALPTQHRIVPACFTCLSSAYSLANGVTLSTLANCMQNSSISHSKTCSVSTSLQHRVDMHKPSCTTATNAPVTPLSVISNYSLVDELNCFSRLPLFRLSQVNFVPCTVHYTYAEMVNHLIDSSSDCMKNTSLNPVASNNLKYEQLAIDMSLITTKHSACFIVHSSSIETSCPPYHRFHPVYTIAKISSSIDAVNNGYVDSSKNTIMSADEHNCYYQRVAKLSTMNGDATDDSLTCCTHIDEADPTQCNQLPSDRPLTTNQSADNNACAQLPRNQLPPIIEETSPQHPSSTSLPLSMFELNCCSSWRDELALNCWDTCHCASPTLCTVNSARLRHIPRTGASDNLAAEAAEACDPFSCPLSLQPHSFIHTDYMLACSVQSAEAAWRNRARSRFKDRKDLIQRLFVCISGVADQLQTNFAADVRYILKVVFNINQRDDTGDQCPSAEICDQAASCSHLPDSQLGQTLLPPVSSQSDSQNTQRYRSISPENRDQQSLKLINVPASHISVSPVNSDLQHPGDPNYTCDTCPVIFHSQYTQARSPHEAVTRDTSSLLEDASFHRSGTHQIDSTVEPLGFCMDIEEEAAGSAMVCEMRDACDHTLYSANLREHSTMQPPLVSADSPLQSTEFAGDYSSHSFSHPSVSE